MLGSSLLALLLVAPALPDPPAAPAPAAPPSAGAAWSPYAWFDPLIDVRELIQQAYVEDADAKRMQEAALGAIVASLGDPFSVYVPPDAERSFNKDLKGTYAGIGAEIDMPDGWLRIVSPLDDSPAQEAGILPGDVVLAIEGKKTQGLSVEACMDLLLGEPGTPVKIDVRHGDGREESYSLVRRQIHTKTVKGFRRTGDGWQYLLDPEHGIAYVRLTQFLESTPADLKAAVARAVGQGAKGLVIDLRYNGGGSLAAAIEIADQFQRKGTIVSLRSRDHQERTWSASESPDDVDLPIVVLVNDASASASEILAGALQDNERAKVLGVRTYGKGSVQDVRTLAEGRGQVKLTIARYYLPSGRNITRSHKLEEEGKPWGVDPDAGFHVPLDDEEARTMFLARRRWELPDGKPTDPARWADPAWVEAAPGDDGVAGLGDRQLAAAMRALRERIAGREWPRVGDDPGSATTASDELRRQIAYRERLAREMENVERRIGELEAEADGKTPPATVPATGDVNK